MPTYPPAEESRDRLHRAGWSVGDVGTAGGGWLVSGTNVETALDPWGRAVCESHRREWPGEQFGRPC
jgi:hypothetical protein